ncbi:MAG: RecQ family ATP-dependent DNA helicase, partial [Bacteroidales bacterium]
FLYVSPERLSSDIFLAHFKQMKLNLLAVDEAHCISQWGYDFRPPYLQIAQIRTCFPKIPVLALTATATTDVVKDIQKRLNFRQENVFQKSFTRENLTYYVIQEEDKLGRMIRIIHKVGGSGIVYVRNRRKTEELANYLVQHGLSASFYHAGMEVKTRGQRQKDWIEGRIQIIVSTNAFGMGIDKPNVRFVIHLDLPNSLEAYFQEAGRGGRDEKRAFAVLLYHPSDKLNLMQQYAQTYPPLEFIKRVYDSLGNYYQIPLGSSGEFKQVFDLKTFANAYKLPLIETYNAILFLEKEGFLFLSEHQKQEAKIFISISHADLYKFQVDNPQYAPLIQTLLRSYGGNLFSYFVPINEMELAQRIQEDRPNLIKSLKKLEALNILEYATVQTGVSLSFAMPRVNMDRVYLSPEIYAQRKAIAKQKLDAVLYYAESTQVCRSKILLNYFGETTATPCGRCDCCLNEKTKEMDATKFKEIERYIQQQLSQQALSLLDLIKLPSLYSEQHLIQVWRHLLDNGLLIESEAKDHTYRFDKTHF